MQNALNVKVKVVSVGMASMSLDLPQEPIQPFNVLAFDPGGTTGWVHATLPQWVLDDVNDPFHITMKDIGLHTGELGPGPHHEELFEFIGSRHRMGYETPLEIVFEPFHFRQHLETKYGKMHGPRHKVELISCEYIGIIKLACAQLGLEYYDRFVPGEAKAYCPNAKLDKLGWLQTPVTPMRHRNDALRQLVKYLIVKKKVRHPLTTAWREDA